jgi:hypothetical protein
MQDQARCQGVWYFKLKLAIDVNCEASVGMVPACISDALSSTGCEEGSRSTHGKLCSPKRLCQGEVVI